MNPAALKITNKQTPHSFPLCPVVADCPSAGGNPSDCRRCEDCGGCRAAAVRLRRWRRWWCRRCEDPSVTAALLRRASSWRSEDQQRWHRRCEEPVVALRPLQGTSSGGDGGAGSATIIRRRQSFRCSGAAKIRRLKSMAEVEQMVTVWNQWGLHVLVMLSFALQVTLLILAELRRRMDSGVLRIFAWSAYMLTDLTAIYVLGHLSVNKRSPEHELMAFWAPFLLLHLGGQDNITAYAIEDNRLWLRHLQTMAVQVAAAGYVLYESWIISSRRSSLLLLATIIMFVVGVVKYGERVWALKCAGDGHRRLLDDGSSRTVGYFKRLSVRQTGVFIWRPIYRFDGRGGSQVVEMQLSLMHDVLYTKAEVMHTWYGLCIRIVSCLSTAVVFVLFNLLMFGDGYDKPLKDYSRVDVAVSYALLVGALILEIMSLLRAMFSSWTCALLRNWGWLHRSKVTQHLWIFLARGRRLTHAKHWRRRYWSGSMGQHNLFQLCAGSRASRCSKIARWMGVEDLWNTVAYSWSIPVTAFIEQLIVKQQVLQSSRGSPDHQVTTINARFRELLEELVPGVTDLEGTVEEDILVWHIATDIYLHWCMEEEERRIMATGR
ncbi:hypothetical protein PR202_gb28705 [Eleusine coracana subsp. coracana]|uniref:DUF4220 domain-containing protein n=1 Tax=Eleusine coracana subsp. coracana TaxID=191504 RepID=A0AAV5FV91_ELECO|nr:hypothetical protein PR202_gb28705 [Eleusine coracana subsp. coracana]